MSSRFEDLPSGEAPAQASPALSEELALTVGGRWIGARPPEHPPGRPDPRAGLPVRAVSRGMSVRRRRRA
jgi:hypothetical protein